MTDRPRAKIQPGGGEEARSLTWGNSEAGMQLAPSHGRLLRLVINGHDVLWVNPADASWNVGGDRLWLGPEAAWFWSKPGSHDVADHQVQVGVDPGTWAMIEATTNRWRLERHDVVLRLSDGAPFTVTGHRSWSVGESSAQFPEGAFTIRTETVLELKGPAGQPASLWNLAQIPPGGLAYVATTETPLLQSYFGPMPAGATSQTGALLQFRITGDARWKAGVGSECSAGVVGYARPVPGGATLLVRQFDVERDADYPDRPDQNSIRGDVVQIFNDSGEFGGFGEVEHHGAPSVTTGAATQLRESFSTIVSFLEGNDWSDQAAELVRMASGVRDGHGGAGQ